MGDSQVIHDHAVIAKRRGPAALEATAVRNRSSAALNVFASCMSDGALCAINDAWAALDHAAGVGTTGARLSDVREWRWTVAAVRAAYLIGARNADETARVFRVCWVAAPEAFERRHVLLFASLASAVDDAELLLDLQRRGGNLKGVDIRAMQADTERALWRRGEGSSGAWLRAITAAVGQETDLFGDFADTEHMFDSLRLGRSFEAQDSGPLISVIMTTFNPDSEALRRAVESVLQQTWRNLELLIVDDASGAASWALLDEVARSDDRVRVLRMTENGGTYRARNHALKFASGEFVTGQDSDDWAHPTRLELQIAPLLDEPRLVGSISQCIRATDELRFLYLGYPAVRLNASSLMFRRHPVQSRIGYFYPARKGADSEIHRRMETVFGPKSVTELSDVLSLVRLNTESLSRADFSPGWHHERRQHFRLDYTAWHKSIASGNSSPFVEDAVQSVPFKTTPTMMSRTGNPQQFDVVFAGDWTRYGGPQKSMLSEIDACLEKGMRVAIANFEPLRFMSGSLPSLCDAVLARIRSGDVTWLLRDDSATIKTLLLRYPPVLQFPPDSSVTWSTDRVLVVANQAPSERDGTDRRYDPKACLNHAAILFGAPAVFVPQSAVIRSILMRKVTPGCIADFDSPGIIRAASWAVSRDGIQGSTPRVGRHSRDEVMKFPESPEALLQIYGLPTCQVNFLGGAASVPRILDGIEVPKNWSLFAYGAKSVQTFLSEIDFFVYFHHPQMVEAFGRAILEAVASGCIAVLPDHFRPVFKESAVYCSPSEVESVVTGLSADPSAMAHQRAAAASVIEREFSPEAFTRRLIGNAGVPH